jgi:hypothetical protein
LRLLVFGGCFVAQTGTHEVLTRVTGHPFRLRIAVCHSLLLRLIWALVSTKATLDGVKVYPTPETI